MINRAVLTGRLTRDPELRYTTGGTAVVSFTLAVDRQFRNQNGERDDDFISCVIWRKAAENFSNFTHKGSRVGVDGRIQTRNYEDNNGNRVYVTEVVVDNFALLDSRNQSDSGYQQPMQNSQQQASQDGFNQQINNQSQQQQNTPQMPQTPNNGYPQSNGQGIDINSNDLPF